MDTLTRLSQNFRAVVGQLSSRYLSQGAPIQVTPARSYSDAVDHLNSLQSNAATLEAVRASGGKLSDLAIPEMLEYLGRIGYTVRLRLRFAAQAHNRHAQPEDLNRLNVIHITGTKGKGSTCAFVDSIVRHVKPDWKVGENTSF